MSFKKSVHALSLNLSTGKNVQAFFFPFYDNHFIEKFLVKMRRDFHFQSIKPDEIIEF